MTMLQLAGPPAATAFRLLKLRTELRALEPAITDAAVRFEHFVHLERPLDGGERRVLEALLDYGGGALDLSGANAGARQRLYVVPRLGTISPWASKATDIARLCDLPVHRVERGRLVELTLGGPLSSDSAREDRAAAPRQDDGDAAQRRAARRAALCGARAEAETRRRRAARRPPSARARERRVSGSHSRRTRSSTWPRSSPP